MSVRDLLSIKEDNTFLVGLFSHGSEFKFNNTKNYPDIEIPSLAQGLTPEPYIFRLTEEKSGDTNKTIKTLTIMNFLKTGLLIMDLSALHSLFKLKITNVGSKDIFPKTFESDQPKIISSQSLQLWFEKTTTIWCTKSDDEEHIYEYEIDNAHIPLIQKKIGTSNFLNRYYPYLIGVTLLTALAVIYYQKSHLFRLPFTNK